MLPKEEALKKIDSDVKNNKILIFMKGNKNFPQCGFSAQAVEVFNRMNVPFETRDVLSDEDYWEYLEDYSKWPTFPQVFIDGKFIGGCDIVTEMSENGELQPLVDAALGNKK